MLCTTKKQLHEAELSLCIGQSPSVLKLLTVVNEFSFLVSASTCVHPATLESDWKRQNFNCLNVRLKLLCCRKSFIFWKNFLFHVKIYAFSVIKSLQPIRTNQSCGTSRNVNKSLPHLRPGCAPETHDLCRRYREKHHYHGFSSCSTLKYC